MVEKSAGDGASVMVADEHETRKDEGDGCEVTHPKGPEIGCIAGNTTHLCSRQARLGASFCTTQTPANYITQAE